jgi:hypothetical protein
MPQPSSVTSTSRNLLAKRLPPLVFPALVLSFSCIVGREVTIQPWLDQEANYNCTTDQCNPSKKCTSYTQVVWDDTQAVGCARYQCFDGSMSLSASGVHLQVRSRINLVRGASSCAITQSQAMCRTRDRFQWRNAPNADRRPHHGPLVHHPHLFRRHPRPSDPPPLLLKHLCNILASWYVGHSLVLSLHHNCEFIYSIFLHFLVDFYSALILS